MEAIIFMGLGLLAVAFIFKMASANSVNKKNSSKLQVVNGNGNALDIDEITKELERLPQRRDAAPTAELQTIGDIDAFQRAQILVDKGQIIEAVKYLVDNAGFDMTKAVNAVDSMGKKVYPAD
jgi:hypothetical protein